jgi:hypothetical protein
MTTYHIPPEPMLGLVDAKGYPWWRYPDGWRRGGHQEDEPILWMQLLTEHGPMRTRTEEPA